jgi:lysophospholipase L1-like esterase
MHAAPGFLMSRKPPHPALFTGWMNQCIPPIPLNTSIMKCFLFGISLICTLAFFRPKQRTWVAIGDSITYLNEHPDETGNRITKGYMTRVVEKMPDIRYTNLGYNGWTSRNIADSIDHIGLVPADIYSIFLGTNDWWQGRPLGTLRDYTGHTGSGTLYGSFGIIISRIRALSPAARIVLITPLQRADFVYIGDMNNNAWGSYKPKNGQTLAQFAGAISEIGRLEHIPVVDLYNEPRLDIKQLVRFKCLRDPRTGKYRNYRYPDFTTVPFHPGTDPYPYPKEAIGMTYDGLHPSDQGYEIIAGLLLRVLKQ